MSTPSPGATLSGLREYASANGIDLHEMKADDGTLVVTPGWGGRILFAGAGEENAFWTQPDFQATGQWGWNKGGARSWFSPEGGPKGIYFSADWSEWQCPAAMDPGAYKVEEKSDTSIRMENTFQATANDGTEYHLAMGREVTVADRPPLCDCIKIMPVRFSHWYRNLGDAPLDQCIDLWHLVQIRPGGVILAPLNDGDTTPYRNYFEPIPEDRVAVKGGCLSVKIDGARRYKLGVTQKRSTGAIAYLRRDGDDASLFLKRFEVFPEGIYADRPESDQEHNGDAVQLYNHDTGGPEGFGEIECHSPAETLAPGATQTFGMDILLLEGPAPSVIAGGCKLLGVDKNEIELFA